jgi:hypothetical protein
MSACSYSICLCVHKDVCSVHVVAPIPFCAKTCWPSDCFCVHASVAWPEFEKSCFLFCREGKSTLTCSSGHVLCIGACVLWFRLCVGARVLWFRLCVGACVLWFRLCVGARVLWFGLCVGACVLWFSLCVGQNHIYARFVFSVVTLRRN